MQNKLRLCKKLQVEGANKMAKKKNKKKSFPDLNKDGKVTMKDILIGRGVIKKANGGVTEAINGLKKQGLKRGGVAGKHHGGVAGRLAQRGYGKSR